MTDLNIEILQQPEEVKFRELDKFIYENTFGNIFQSTYYFKIFYGSKHNKPGFLICRNNLQQIKGVVLYVIQYQISKPFAYFTSRSLIIGGPLVENNDEYIFQALLSYYDKFISQKVIYSQIRNLNDTFAFRNIFQSLDYTYEDHLNIVVDLLKTEELLWKEMHSKRRNEIKRAEKELLYVKLIENTDDFTESYKVLKALYRQIGLPLYEKDIFLRVFNDNRKDEFFRFFGVYFEEKLVGTMYTFCFKSKIYNWFAGSYENFYKKYPNDLLPWKVFLWGKENGYSFFDWGGAGKPGVKYGVRDYKAKFGGDFVNYGRYEKIHNKMIFNFVSRGFRILSFLKKKFSL